MVVVVISIKKIMLTTLPIVLLHKPISIHKSLNSITREHLLTVLI